MRERAGERVIDKRRAAFINFDSFGVPGTGRLAFRRAFSPLWLVVIWVCGCSPKHTPGPVEDSLTSGRIRVVCAPEAQRLIEREKSAFEALYPAAEIRVKAGPSREAVRSLFAAECDLAVI